MWQVWSHASGMFHAARESNGLGLLFPTEDAAQAFCDGINAKCDLESRKNAALDWALANEDVLVTREEIEEAVWRTPDCIGLLDFENRMCDAPLVVEPR